MQNDDCLTNAAFYILHFTFSALHFPYFGHALRSNATIPPSVEEVT
jgi:hypothetical protein